MPAFLPRHLKKLKHGWSMFEAVDSDPRAFFEASLKQVWSKFEASLKQVWSTNIFFRACCCILLVARAMLPSMIVKRKWFVVLQVLWHQVPGCCIVAFRRWRNMFNGLGRAADTLNSHLWPDLDLIGAFGFFGFQPSGLLSFGWCMERGGWQLGPCQSEWIELECLWYYCCGSSSLGCCLWLQECQGAHLSVHLKLQNKLSPYLEVLKQQEKEQELIPQEM